MTHQNILWRATSGLGDAVRSRYVRLLSICWCSATKGFAAPNDYQILTDKLPFHEKNSDIVIFQSLLKGESPGEYNLLLSLVPDASKPEHASTLRLLHSYLPLCWASEPRKRPLISVLLRQVFMFSFESDPGDSVVVRAISYRR